MTQSNNRSGHMDYEFRDLFPVNQLPSRLPPTGPAGSRLSYGTMWRWVTKGLRGRKLKAVRIGGQWYTTQQWVGDFITSTSCTTETSPEAELRTPSQRDRAIAAAQKLCEAAGL